MHLCSPHRPAIIIPPPAAAAVTLPRHHQPPSVTAAVPKRLSSTSAIVHPPPLPGSVIRRPPPAAADHHHPPGGNRSRRHAGGCQSSIIHTHLLFERHLPRSSGEAYQWDGCRPTRPKDTVRESRASERCGRRSSSWHRGNVRGGVSNCLMGMDSV
jgi:hypothetical protein